MLIDFRHKRPIDLAELAQVKDRLVTLLCEPVEADGRRQAPPGELGLYDEET
ncbi:MAG: hypothetical protein JO284_15925 [Planctomycetaceae bacterium]|nr:hypothetical protein [Planctomycetaceae bacterium]